MRGTASSVRVSGLSVSCDHGETKKVKQLHSVIPKVKTKIVTIRTTGNETIVRNNLKQTKLDFFSRKYLKEKPSKLQYYVVRKLRNLIYYLNACYLIHIIYLKCMGSGIQNTGKPNRLLSVITVC